MDIIWNSFDLVLQMLEISQIAIVARSSTSNWFCILGADGKWKKLKNSERKTLIGTFSKS